LDDARRVLADTRSKLSQDYLARSTFSTEEKLTGKKSDAHKELLELIRMREGTLRAMEAKEMETVQEVRAHTGVDPDEIPEPVRVKTASRGEISELLQTLAREAGGADGATGEAGEADGS